MQKYKKVVSREQRVKSSRQQVVARRKTDFQIVCISDCPNI